jgi:hypothetical protein
MNERSSSTRSCRVKAREVWLQPGTYADDLVTQQAKNADYDGPTRWRYVQFADLVAAAKAIAAQCPAELSGVAAVPRSGMIPAAVIAHQHHLPLFELSLQHGLQPIGAGARGAYLKVRPSKPILVVDDTVYSGRAIQSARARMDDRPAIYAACFIRPGYQHYVDLYGEVLPSPHLLEWNLWNSGLLAGYATNPVLRGGFCCDFDGVLCEDCPVDGDDTAEGDERYRQWILNAKPKHIPRLSHIPLVVTYRLERFRPETDWWLQKWGITVGLMAMHRGETFAERNRNFNPAEYKGEILLKSRCCAMIESNDRQARQIFLHAGKPVLALDTGRFYQ